MNFYKYGLITLGLLTGTKTWAYAPDLSNPNFLPVESDYALFMTSGSSKRDIEYNANGVRVDYQQYKSNLSELKGLTTGPYGVTLGFNFLYDSDREYEVHYGPASSKSGTSPFMSHSRGFIDPDIIIAKTFEPANDKWNQQLYLLFNPFDIREEPKKIYRGGNDFLLDYRFSHIYSRGELHGKLFSHYFGKKVFYQPGDVRTSTSDPYTEVGIQLGYIFHLSQQWYLRTSGLFGQTSDYTINTPDVQREADKGHQTAGNIELTFRPNYFWQFGVEFHSSSRVYNANNEEISRNIEYESEEEGIKFNFRYRGGF
jgi:hypothetical protein